MSGVQQLILGTAQAYPIVVDAADFDGANDMMTRGASIDGAADSKLFTFVCWINADTLAGADRRIFNSVTTVGGTTTRLNITWTDADSNIQIRARNAAGTTILNMQAATPGTGTWVCLMFSCDLADTGKRQFYYGDTDTTPTVVAYTDDAIDNTVADWAVGAAANGTEDWDGCFAELWYKIGVYIDFSNEGNRRKFISEGGKPVYLGATGNLPTGAAPDCYFHLADGAAVAGFATNLGTGGNFAITGTLATCGSSPSD